MTQETEKKTPVLTPEVLATLKPEGAKPQPAFHKRPKPKPVTAILYQIPFVRGDGQTEESTLACDLLGERYLYRPAILSLCSLKEMPKKYNTSIPHRQPVLITKEMAEAVGLGTKDISLGKIHCFIRAAEARELLTAYRATVTPNLEDSLIDVLCGTENSVNTPLTVPERDFLKTRPGAIQIHPDTALAGGDKPAYDLLFPINAASQVLGDRTEWTLAFRAGIIKVIRFFTEKQFWVCFEDVTQFIGLDPAEALSTLANFKGTGLDSLVEIKAITNAVTKVPAYYVAAEGVERWLPKTPWEKYSDTVKLKAEYVGLRLAPLIRDMLDGVKPVPVIEGHGLLHTKPELKADPEKLADINTSIKTVVPDVQTAAVRTPEQALAAAPASSPLQEAALQEEQRFATEFLTGTPAQVKAKVVEANNELADELLPRSPEEISAAIPIKGKKTYVDEPDIDSLEIVSPYTDVIFDDVKYKVITYGGKSYILLSQLCKVLGIRSYDQRKKVLTDPKYTTLVIPCRDVKGKLQNTLALDLDCAHAWLFGVNSRKVNPSARGHLLRYQKELVAVIRDYMTRGIVANPRLVPKEKLDELQDKFSDFCAEAVKAVESRDKVIDQYKDRVVADEKALTETKQVLDASMQHIKETQPLVTMAYDLMVAKGSINTVDLGGYLEPGKTFTAQFVHDNMVAMGLLRKTGMAGSINQNYAITAKYMTENLVDPIIMNIQRHHHADMQKPLLRWRIARLDRLREIWRNGMAELAAIEAENAKAKAEVPATVQDMAAAATAITAADLRGMAQAAIPDRQTPKSVKLAGIPEANNLKPLFSCSPVQGVLEFSK